MQTFREMTNLCIRVGLENNITTLKRLSLSTYNQLKSFDVPSYYKLCAVSRASGILSSRKKSIRRGYPTKAPYARKLVLVSCYGFKVEDGKLFVPFGDREYEQIPLNNHTREVLSDPTLRVRSFTLTEGSLSLCISKDVEEMEGLTSTVGVDRNLENIAVGNSEHVTFYDVREVVRIGQVTREIVGSFKRNDHRIRKRIASKYGIRRRRRVVQILHRISKAIVQSAKENREAIVFEDIRHIRGLYRKGNGQGASYRGRMNSWPFAEVKRQIEYKARWEGVPVVQLSKSDTRGTSSLCPKCGERLPRTRGATQTRQLWCQRCGEWFDRDLVAVLNISRRGWMRFVQSKGLPIEAMRQERGLVPPILRVDGSKLGRRESNVPKT
jgi:putative transposase